MNEELDNIEFEKVKFKGEDDKLNKNTMNRKFLFVLIAVLAIVFISKFSKQSDFNPAFPSTIYQIDSIKEFQELLRENMMFSLFVLSIIGIVIIEVYMYIKVRKGDDSFTIGKGLKGLFEIMTIVPYFILAISIVNMSLFSVSVIEGRSMEPNFFDSENTIINHLDHSYNRFDVVIIRVPYEGYWIKRVIGLPGETVVIDHNEIYIDGVLIEQEFLEDENGMMINYTYCSGTDPEYCTFFVAEEAYFVLGDNRPVSNDSRSSDLGLVTVDQLHGVVVYKYEGNIFNIYK